MSGLSNTPWQLNKELQKFLEGCVLQGLPRNVILNAVKSNFGTYKWSKRTLVRRLKHFDLKLKLERREMSRNGDFEEISLGYEVCRCSNL